MKIVHVGLMANGRDEGLSYELRRHATQYAEFPVNVGAVNFLRNLSWTPDILFFQIHSDNVDGTPTVKLFSNVIQELQQKGTKVINWNGDIRNSFPHWMAHFPADVTAFANMRDVKSIARNGTFLQIGIDPTVFKRWSTKRNNDVVFMGNNYGNQFPLGPFRLQAARLLLNKFNAKIYGNYPGAVKSLNADPNNPFPNQSAESRIYSECAIAISISHYNVERYTSDRLFRCMGSGAFTLAHHYTGIEQDFEIGKHLDTFRDLNEMQQKIDYWLSNPEQREEIAKNGHDHVHENFTYKQMAENLIKLVK